MGDVSPGPSGKYHLGRARVTSGAGDAPTNSLSQSHDCEGPTMGPNWLRSPTAFWGASHTRGRTLDPLFLTGVGTHSPDLPCELQMLRSRARSETSTSKLQEPTFLLFEINYHPHPSRHSPQEEESSSMNVPPEGEGRDARSSLRGKSRTRRGLSSRLLSPPPRLRAQGHVHLPCPHVLRPL